MSGFLDLAVAAISRDLQVSLCEAVPNGKEPDDEPTTTTATHPRPIKMEGVSSELEVGRLLCL